MSGLTSKRARKSDRLEPLSGRSGIVQTGKRSGVSHNSVASWAQPLILAIPLSVIAVGPGGAQESTVRAPVRDLFGAIFDPNTGPTFDIGGDISADLGFKHGDDALAFDSAILRRARLGVEGRIIRRLGYRIVGDFSDGTFGLAESYFVFRHDWQTGQSINLRRVTSSLLTPSSFYRAGGS